MADKFKLFACCVPVKGYSRSVICDLQREKIKFIPNWLHDTLIHCDGQSIDTIIAYQTINNHDEVVEYINILVNEEFGFWCDDPLQFPNLNLSWETPFLVTNGIIDHNEQSRHDYANIFQQFEAIGCKYLQLRFYTTIDINLLKYWLCSIRNTTINSLELILKYSPTLNKDELVNLGLEISKIDKITIHSSPMSEKFQNPSKLLPFSITFISQNIDSNTHCGIIGKNYFVINQNTFTESQKYNSCLNKKISIDVDGSIKNCPSMVESYGNVKDRSLLDVILHTNFKRLWNINKNQIDVCKDCEFRYICTDCRAFLDSDFSIEKPKKCSYNPYEMTWKD